MERRSLLFRPRPSLLKTVLPSQSERLDATRNKKVAVVGNEAGKQPFRFLQDENLLPLGVSFSFSSLTHAVILSLSVQTKAS